MIYGIRFVFQFLTRYRVTAEGTTTGHIWFGAFWYGLWCDAVSRVVLRYDAATVSRKRRILVSSSQRACCKSSVRIIVYVR